MKIPVYLSRVARPLALMVGLVLAGQPLTAAAAPEYSYMVPLEGSDQTITQGQLTLSQTAHDFGTVVLGSSVAITTTLKNTGQDAVALTNFTVSAPFSQSNSCPSTLVGGASCSITVTYNPQSAGNHASAVTVEASAPVASAVLSLTAKAVVPTTNLTLSENSVSFPNTDVGAAAATKTLTITNGGNSPATVTGIGVTTGVSDFSESNNCGGTLAPGASCTINVSFVPTLYGSRSGGLSVFESASGTLYNIALVGSGNDAVMGLSMTTLDLGAAIANYSSTTGTFTVSNTGNLPMADLSFDTGASDFSVGATTCAATLAPASSCTVTVKFTPSAAGARTGSIQVHTSNAGSGAVSLQGDGVAQAPSASVSATTLTFAPVPVDGASATQDIVFTNTGNVVINVTSVALSSGAPNFQVASGCGATLNVGASCTATVTFTPKQANAQTGAIRAVLSSGTLNTTLTGTGTLGIATVSPATLSFGAQQVASPSTPQVVLVTNTGNRNLTISSVGLSAGGSHYAQSNNCTLVKPTENCTVTVVFTPSATGDQSGTLALVHDGVDELTTVALSGSGSAQTGTLSTPTFGPTAVGSSTTAVATLANTGIGALAVTTPSAASVTGAGYSFVSTTCGSTVAVSASCTVTVRFSPTTTSPASGALAFTTGAGAKSVTLGSTGIQGFASVSPGSLTFAAQQNGSTSAVQTVTVTNTGTDVLTFTGVGIANGASDFAQSNGCGAVPVNGTCSVNVSFTPSAAGTRTGDLTFTHNGGGIANVSLTGTGQGASATLSAPSFATTQVGNNSTAVFTLTNTGIGSISVVTPTAAAVTGTDFSFASTTCGTTLGAGATCTTTVRFSPTATTARTGSLSISTGAGAKSAVLGATGVQGTASLSAGSVTFGATQVGTAAAAQTVTVTNTGTSVLTFTSVSVTAGASDFTQTSPACTSLAVNATCVITVNFTPTATSARPGTVTLAHNGTGATAISLAGTGQAQSASLSAPSFPATAVGANSTATATLTNTGVGTLSTTAPSAASVTGAGYSFVSTTCGASLAPAAACSTTVRFSPTSTAEASGSLTIATGAGTKTATLGSTGIQGFATVSPSSLTFAAQQNGTTSATQVVTVTNTGTNTLTFTGVGISAGGTDFAQSNGCGAVAVNGTCTVNVTFTPSAAGPLTGTLSFTHNGGGIANVSLSGTGQAQSGTLSTPDFSNTIVVGSFGTANSTLTNTGIGAITLTTPSAASVTGTDYSFVSTTCGTSLAASATCTTTLRFSPTAPTTRTGSFVVVTSAGTKTVSMSEVGIQGNANLSVGSLTYASTQIGTTAATQAVTVTNTGTNVLTFTSISVTAGTTDYSLTSPCTTLAVNATCAITVSFTPTASGARAGTVTVAHNGTGSTSFSLSGTGQGQSAALSTPSFPATAVGANSTAIATLSNTGIGTLSTTAPTAASVSGAGYSFVSTTCTTSLPVSGTCTTTVRFSPTSTTAASGTLAIATGAGTQTVTLGSTGIQGFASISPSSLTFAAQQNGSTSAVQTVTVTNTGTNTLTFTGVGVSAGGTDFAQSNNCGTVAVNGTCTASVSFTPSASGTRPGTLSFTHNGGGIANVSLTGTGQAQTATLTTPSFSATTVGSNSTAVATLTNTGIGALSITTPVAGSVTGTDFSFVSTTCGTTLAASGACTTTVRFSPTATTARTGSLSFATGAGTKTASLSAAGAQGVASLSQGSIAFSPKQVGESVVAGAVTVTNTGNAPLTFTSVSMTAGAANFSQTSPACATLAVNGTCTISVTFAPSTTGSLTGTVTLAHNGSGATALTLTGTGQAQGASLSTPAFPATAVGSTNTAVATLTNTGVGTLTLTAPVAGSVTGAAYSFVSTTCGTSLAAGGTCATTVRFSPTSTSAASGSLAIATGAGTQTVALGSTGIQGFASVNPASLTFGITGQWATSAAQVVTVTNTGTNTLTFTGVGISAGSSDFAQSNNCGSVAVNGTCTVNVTFSPSAAGARTGTLSFTHNGGGIANVSLSGTGNTPTATLSMGAFPATAVGASSTAVATLTNNSPYGPMPVGTGTVTGNAAFSVVSTTCSSMIPASGNCTTIIRFSPTSNATVTGNFAINDWNQWHNAALSAAGQQAGVSLAPASLTFANGTTSTTSSNQSTTLTNNGNVPLTVTSVTVTAGGTAFSRSTTCVGTIAVNGTCTITGTFAPVGAGANTGTITIAHNGSGPTTIALSGTAYVPATVTAAAFAPATVSSGSLSNFSWTSANASSATVACSGTAVGSGSGAASNFNVNTSGTGAGTCTVTAYNPAGTPATRSATLTVVAAPLVTGASFSPSTVASGAGSTFSWTSSNATSATVSCSAPAAGSGSGTSGSIAVTTSGTGTGTCTVTATNAAGNVSTGSANLSVQALPTIPTYGFAAASATVGVNNNFSWTTGNTTSAYTSCTTGGSSTALSGSLGAVGTTAGQTVTCTTNATNAVGTIGRSSSFTVIAPPAVTNTSFSAATVAPGTNNTFSWATTGATSASVSCSGVAGGSSSALNGSLAVSTTGTGTGTCTVTAYNATGSTATRSSSYSSISKPTATSYFDKTTNTTGTSTTFRWSTSGATVSTNVDCWGSAAGTYRGSAATGALTVTVSGTGAGYCNVAAINAAGQTDATASLTTVAAPSVTGASFSPTTVFRGNASTFSWSTSNATSASVACSGAAVGSGSGTSGSISVTNNATGTGTCTVTATNAAGSTATGSANVSVVAAAPTASISTTYAAVTMTGAANGYYGPYTLYDPNSQGQDYYYVNWFNTMYFSGAYNVTITNSGGGSLTLGSLSNNGEYYRYEDPYNSNNYYNETTTQAYNCDGAVLAAGQSCVINMTYSYGYEEYSYSKIAAGSRPGAADVTYTMPTSAGNKTFVISWR
jgi:hypothetical protein